MYLREKNVNLKVEQIMIDDLILEENYKYSLKKKNKNYQIEQVKKTK